MDSVMVNQIDEKQWYLAVGERSLGPISTDLVARGIRSGKVPVTAWVCQVGDNSWASLSSFGEFQEALETVLASSVPANEGSDAGRSPAEATDHESPDNVTSLEDEAMETSASGALTTDSQGLPSDDEEEATGKRSLLPYERTDSELEPSPTFTAEQAEVPPNVFSSVFGEDDPGRGDENSFADISGQREVDPAIRQEAADALREHSVEADSPAATSGVSSTVCDDDLGIDITFDEDELGSIDWKERFQSYFLVGAEIQLPEEEKLLQSLQETPKATFLHDEALWNLALCLAFGSDVVAEASALKFYDALDQEQELDRAPERVEWICRTLLSKGFMPSGIPRMEGIRGIDMLRLACPDLLREVLERETGN